MLYLTCTTITSIDLAHYEVSRAKYRVSVDCVTTSEAEIYVDGLYASWPLSIASRNVFSLSFVRNNIFLLLKLLYHCVVSKQF